MKGAVLQLSVFFSIYILYKFCGCTLWHSHVPQYQSNNMFILCFFGLGSPPKKNRQKKPSLSTNGIMGCTQLPRTNYLPLRIATIPEQRNILPRKTRVSLKDDGFFQTGPFLLWPGHFSCIFGWYIKITFHDRWNRPTFGISKTATTCRKSSEMTGWRYA